MRILFIHNTAMWYRIPFFKKLNELFNVKFLFTEFNLIGEIYDESYKKALKGLKGLNYKILNGIDDLIEELVQSDYDVIIGGGWGSIPEIFRSLIVYIIGKLKGKKIILFHEDWNWGILI